MNKKLKYIIIFGILIISAMIMTWSIELGDPAEEECSEGQILAIEDGIWNCVNIVAGNISYNYNNTNITNINNTYLSYGNNSFNQSLTDSLYYSSTNPSGYINTETDPLSIHDLDELCSTDGKILKRIGGAWVCATDQEGSGTANGLNYTKVWESPNEYLLFTIP